MTRTFLTNFHLILPLPVKQFNLSTMVCSNCFDLSGLVCMFLILPNFYSGDVSKNRFRTTLQYVGNSITRWYRSNKYEIQPQRSVDRIDTIELFENLLPDFHSSFVTDLSLLLKQTFKKAFRYHRLPKLEKIQTLSLNTKEEPETKSYVFICFCFLYLLAE